MDVNGMCARFFPEAGLVEFTAKRDESGNSDFAALAGGWGRFTGTPISTADLEAKEAEYETELEAARQAEKNATDLTATDAGMARVLEDVIALGVSKGLWSEADLPQSAQNKLITRRNLRAE
tara:strand:- start:8642 stop:9007 length:366 start_codon:yes stop_codon:yes gene_type:complete